MDRQQTIDEIAAQLREALAWSCRSRRSAFYAGRAVGLATQLAQTQLTGPTMLRACTLCTAVNREVERRIVAAPESEE